MITIYIPTCNRAQFLIRGLKYYADLKYDGKIIIGDSSNDEESQRIQRYITMLPDLEISYYRYPPPPYPMQKVFEKLVSKIETKYFICSGDDDFLVPEGLIECINFLEKNTDYIVFIV